MRRIRKRFLALMLLTAVCCTGQITQGVDIEVFEFNDSNGTELMNAANSVTSNQWSTPNAGADMFPSSVESGSYRIIKDFDGLAQNHLDIDNITSGTVYLSATFSSWKFTGHDPNNPEQVRLAFLNTDGVVGSEITAQMQIRRSPETDPNADDYGRIELRGDAAGTAGSSDISFLAPLNTEQTNPFTMVLALDQGSDTYEIFYKDGTNPTQVLGRASISRVRDANSVRLAVNNNLGSTNLFPTFIDEQVNIDRIALTDDNPLTDLITLEVDRDTGAMTLKNTSGAVINNIESYSITSESGALDSSQWKTIAGNYDDSVSGDGSVDSNDLWSVGSTTAFELSESMQTGNADPEDGGTLSIGQNVELDLTPLSAPGTWLKNPGEDVHMVLTLAGGETRTVSVDYIGNGGARFGSGDLDFDGDIDGNDWLIFNSFAETDLSSLSPAEAYQRGDLDGNLTNDVEDFDEFKDLYNATNPIVPFEQMIAGIPEPGSILLAFFGVVGLASRLGRDF